MTNTSMGAKNVEACRRPVTFFPRARDGFSAYLLHVKDTHPRVLLPGYVGWSPREGSGVLDPVIEAGMSFAFYGVSTQFEIQLDVLERMVAEGPPTVILLIHYFGRRSPATEQVQRIARDHDARLVEDWAHGLFGHASSRPIGHAAIYSLHKMLPMRNGGCLISDLTVAGTSSDLASAVLQYDVDHVAQIRRRNFQDLQMLLREARLPETLLKLPWNILNETDVPQSLPVYVPAAFKDHLYHQLNDAGIGTSSLYHTMVEHITIHQFPNAHWMSRNILNLPVHQDISSEQASHIARVFLGCLLSENVG